MRQIKKAQQLFGEHTLSIIIALLCLVVLIYLAGELYGLFLNKPEIENEEVNLFLGKTFNFEFLGEKHNLTLINLEERNALILVNSFPIFLDFFVGKVSKIDINEDNYYDLELKLISTNLTKKEAILNKRIIKEKPKQEEDRKVESYGLTTEGITKTNPKYTFESLPPCKYVGMDRWEKVSYPEKICTSGVDGCLVVVIISEKEASLLHISWRKDNNAQEMIRDSVNNMKTAPKKAFIFGGYTKLSEPAIELIEKELEKENIKVIEIKEHFLKNKVLTASYDTEDSTLNIFQDFNEVYEVYVYKADSKKPREKPKDRLYPLDFFNQISEEDKFSIENFSKKIGEDIKTGNYSAIIIGEFHYQENQKDAAIEIIKEITKNKKIIFLEEGYGNTLAEGGEIFTKGGVLNEKGEIVEVDKYKNFLENLDITSKKIFNQYSPCDDVKKEISSLKENEILITYTGALHTSNDYYDFSGSSKSNFVEEIPIKDCIDELNKTAIIIIMFDLNPLIKISNSIESHEKGEIEKTEKGSFFGKYKDDVYVGAFWDKHRYLMELY